MIAVKSYFDGSQSRRALTLAGIAADETTWLEMESLWEEVRQARGNPPHIHMTYLMALKTSTRDGQTTNATIWLMGCSTFCSYFRGNPNVFSFSCSINLADYENVRPLKNLPSPERMCARFVFPHVMNWYGELQRLDIGRIEAYFDRGEKFMRHVEPDWRSKQIRKRHPQWELVNSICPAVMEKTPALQITDVVAWGRNRLAGGSHVRIGISNL